MSFNDFYATITVCADLNAEFGSEFFNDEPVAGYTFCNGAYWIAQNDNGWLYVQVGISEYETRDLFDAAWWLWENYAAFDLAA